MIDPRLEQVLEAWFDYEHSPDEDVKETNRLRREKYIKDILKRAHSSASVGDFLAAYKETYRNWLIRKKLKHAKRRF